MEAHWQAYLESAWREYEGSRTRPAKLFPHYTHNDTWQLLDISELSAWRSCTYDHGNWTAGFWFGVMWFASMGTGEDGPMMLARDRIKSLSERSRDHTTHDLGFLFYPSVVLGLTNGFLNHSTEEWALEAAQMTTRRFNAAGRYIQAFGAVGEWQSAGTSTIDTMLNLPLLWWASHRDADPALFDVARHHARTSARVFLRADGSTAHLLRFEPTSGALLEESTLQGANARSSWSRGQAWAVCGFAWAYAATGESELLAAAERAAAYFWRQLPPQLLPPWDFADENGDAPRDASAAVVAALGALILGRVHPDPSMKTRFTEEGSELLDSACDGALNQDPNIDGILLESCYSYPHGRGINGATAWGDFYVGLALALAVGVVPLDRVLGFPEP